MITKPAAAWTDSARAGLERYFEVRLAPGNLEGADPADLRSGLETHLEEEFAMENLALITLEDLRRALARMGETLPPHPVVDGLSKAFPAMPPLPAMGPPPAVPDHSPPRPTAAKTGTSWLDKPLVFLFFAALLPAFTFLFEAATRSGSAMFFDTMPDVLHHFLVLLVPVAGFVIWKAGKPAAGPRLKKAAAWLLGPALAASGFYAICFLPVVPLAAIGIIWFGLGLLPLAPLLAWWAFMRARKTLGERGDSAALRPVKIGFRLMAVAILLLELPAFLTQVGIHRAQAAGTDSEAWASTTRFIRRFGSDAALLRACYSSTSRGGMMNVSAPDPATWIARWAGLSQANARSAWDGDLTVSRDLHFRVTGRAFNESAPPSKAAPIFHNAFNPMGRGALDTDRGGTAVAGRIPGLSLAEGRIDWHCEAASGLTWGEWTMTFSNTTGTAEEARCRIALPPGGFVSRVTLWVNGQPEEAAYSTVSKVRAAYQSVAVVQQRDPVLVTQPDAGSILVQAFPVPARGQLKTRITFTVPAGSGQKIWLPSMVERNFEWPENLRQPLWIQADRGTLTLPSPLNPHAALEAGCPTVTAALEADSLTGNGLAFTWNHEPAPVVFCEDPFAGPEAKIIVRENAPGKNVQPGAIAWVIDTSARLAPWNEAIRTAMADLTGSTKTAVFLPGDAAEELRALTNIGDAKISFAGGRDNIPALTAAVEWLRGQPGGCLVWIHGPQPASPALREGLDQVLDRSVSPFTLIDLPLVPGENAVSSLFSGRPRIAVQQVRLDEAGLPASLNAGWQIPGGTFRTLPAGTAPPEGAVKTSDTLARWFARTEASRLALTDPAAASNMAASHQIVSPWSGAVVLERASDYAQHGLQQADANVAQPVPVIPEPSGVLLLLLSASHFLLRRRRTGTVVF